MKAILFLLLVPMQLCAQDQDYSHLSKSDIHTAFRIALDEPRLQQYFHIEKYPSAQIIVQEFGPVDAEALADLEKFGKPVLVLSEGEIALQKIDRYFSVSDLTAVGDKLRLQLSYPAEGLIISYFFERTAKGWRLTNFDLVEQ